MAAITTGVLLAGALGLGALQMSQDSKAQREAEKAQKKRPPTIDPEAEREELAKRSAKARASIKGGFGSSDTGLGGAAVAPLAGKGAKTLLGA